MLAHYEILVIKLRLLMKNMIRFLLSILLVTSASVLHAQTMVVTPDSGYDGVSVTIVGIGTKFATSNNISLSSPQVWLQQSGNNIGYGAFPAFVNDSTITATIAASTLGWYGVEVKVWVDDTVEHIFTQDSAFKLLVTPPVPPSITYVFPPESYDSETFQMTIDAQSTNFDTGSLPTISFQQNGVTFFTGHADSAIDVNTLAATVTVPRSIPAGVYDIIVRNGIYSDTGKSLFSVQGPFPTTAHVPMRMTPDSGYQGQQLSVTIVGSGTNFTPSSNASMSGITITLSPQNSGSLVAQSTSFSLVNDSTIQAVMNIDDVLVGKYYNLTVVVTDTTTKTYIQDSAFIGTQVPPSIIAISPPSSYSAQTDTLQIQGLYTTFQNGQSPTVLFQQNGATVFSSESNNVISNFSIVSIVTVPGSAPVGSYDVVAENGIYSDTGKQKFSVLGPQPILTLVPDSGAGSTWFDVSIVGQYTDFAPSIGISSMPITMTINLNQNGFSAYQTTADTIFSTTLAHAIFALPDSFPQGVYDAEITGNTYSGSSYDLHTPFFVKPSITIGIHSPPVAMRGDTVTVSLTGSLVNFIYQGNQSVKTVLLVNFEAGDTAISQSVTVTNDTTLSAFFTIPPNIFPGLYDIVIVEPGTNRTLIGTNKFTIERGSGVTENTSFPDIINAIHIFPNPSNDAASISFTMAAPSPVRLLIYDALGRTVATLCNRELGTGTQTFEWASDNVPDGSYFYEILAGDDRYGGRIVVQH